MKPASTTSVDVPAPKKLHHLLVGRCPTRCWAHTHIYAEPLPYARSPRPSWRLVITSATRILVASPKNRAMFSCHFLAILCNLLSGRYHPEHIASTQLQYSEQQVHSPFYHRLDTPVGVDFVGDDTNIL